MQLVGLTGAMGSGKSTVAAMLEARGAVIIDADRITRELQQPGTPVFEAMVARFGDQIVAEDGNLDRQRVADIVFADPEELAALNDIVHPAVGAAMLERLAALGSTDAVVVLDVPLLVESTRWELDRLVVVDVDPELAIERLVQHRKVDEADARARLAAQASRAERLERANHVVSNEGDLEALSALVDALWRTLISDAPGTGDSAPVGPASE